MSMLRHAQATDKQQAQCKIDHELTSQKKQQVTVAINALKKIIMTVDFIMAGKVIRAQTSAPIIPMMIHLAVIVQPRFAMMRCSDQKGFWLGKSLYITTKL